MLEIGGTPVVRSEGGPLEAEYALFDASEIELRATEYGAIREVGYRTTVADALARLDAAGATSAVVRDLVVAIHATASRYVCPRGLPLLGVLTPAELLTAERFEVERKAYVSPLIDLHRLAGDVGSTGAGAALQAAGLAAWLREAKPDEEVVLRTADYMAPRRPGERSIRRVSLAALRTLAPAVSRLRDQGKGAAPPDVDAEALADWLQRRGLPPVRMAWADLVLKRGRLASTGPLAEPRAVAIDVLIGAEHVGEALPLIDRLEVETGRTPAVHYLRLRAALVGKTEPAVDIAERAQVLLAKDPSHELKLLLARAWNEAGQAGKAASIAGEVLADHKAHSSLKDEARGLVEVKAELVVEPARHAAIAPAPPTSNVPGSVRPTPGGLMRPSAPNLVLDLPRPPSPSVVEMTGLGFSQRPTPVPPAYSADRDQQARPFIMGVVATTPEPPTVSRAPTPVAPQISAMPTRPPPAGMNPAAMAEAQRSMATARPPNVSLQTPMRESNPAPQSAWIRGASQPPYQSAPPSWRPPPIVFEPRPPENAETLSLPPGLHGQAVPFDAVPKTVAEARVLFTLLSRSLGRTYRERFGVPLRTDLSGIEAMQRVLRERFTVPAIRSAEEASEVRSHGAFLSEILARSFGAEWSDIAPSELGYWAMTTPSGLRVWPFGRVLRFILQGHRERDLVSYYLELEARLRGR